MLHKEVCEVVQSERGDYTFMNAVSSFVKKVVKKTDEDVTPVYSISS
jgi:hypothetical protein